MVMFDTTEVFISDYEYDDKYKSFGYRYEPNEYKFDEKYMAELIRFFENNVKKQIEWTEKPLKVLKLKKEFIKEKEMLL